MEAAAVPLNFTVDPGVNPVPWISTTVPGGPLPGEKPVIERVGVKLVELVPVPAAVVTEIGPATAPLGTLALSWVGERTVKPDAATPPNLTLLAPLRYVPVMIT